MFLIATGGIIGIIVGGVILICLLVTVFWFIAKHNYFRRMEIKIDESASDIDVALNRRFDLLTKEYEICKGYAKHESATLSEIIRMRQAPSSSKEGKVDMEKLSRINDGLNRLAGDIHVTMEQYPNLKADKVFLSLAESCRDVEEHLEAARRLYNSNVSLYNQEIVVFPSSIVASFAHCQKRELFKVEEGKSKDVKLEF